MSLSAVYFLIGLAKRAYASLYMHDKPERCAFLPDARMTAEGAGRAYLCKHPVNSIYVPVDHLLLLLSIPNDNETVYKTNNPDAISPR